MTERQAKTFVPFHFLWASAWPMFVLSLGVSFLLGRNAVAGGIGALLTGTAVAARIAARPVFTTREAFQRGLPAVIVVFGAFSFLLNFGLTAQQLQLRGMDRSTSNWMAAALVLGEAVLWSVALAGAAAPVVARRARALRPTPPAVQP